MSGYEIVSADAHVLEPTDIWDTWLPKEYRDKAPKLVKDADGGDAWLFAGATDPDPIGLVSTPGMAWDDFRWTGITYEQARAGCYNGSERIKDMDIDGVDAEILFPPQRTIGHFLGDEDDEFVMAGIEAYNNFLFDEFMAPDPTRLIGMAQIPSLGTDVAIETMRKAKARGFKGVVISMWPSGGVSMIETGVGWIPHFLEQIDDRYWRNRSWGNIPIHEAPSYYWFRNMSATFISDFNGIENRHGVGVDNIMWSTDYPHHGNDWPYSRKTISDMMGHIPRDERRKIVADNAVRIFGLDH